ncbi:hypothetical protein [Shumkonia mesophila]|uniref:hypothetical protein n=1 Tax=Shumkonia mesophila TaxID=2838854 RepID=UPI00293432D4|nr:hypothetical protein [Shumkonia mesophila]
MIFEIWNNYKKKKLEREYKERRARDWELTKRVYAEISARRQQIIDEIEARERQEKSQRRAAAGR